MSRRKPIALLPLSNATLPESFGLAADATAEEVKLWHGRMIALLETMEGLDRLVLLRHEPEVDALYPVTIPAEV